MLSRFLEGIRELPTGRPHHGIITGGTGKSEATFRWSFEGKHPESGEPFEFDIRCRDPKIGNASNEAALKRGTWKRYRNTTSDNLAITVFLRKGGRKKYVLWTAGSVHKEGPKPTKAEKTEMGLGEGGARVQKKLPVSDEETRDLREFLKKRVTSEHLPEGDLDCLKENMKAYRKFEAQAREEILNWLGSARGETK